MISKERLAVRFPSPPKHYFLDIDLEAHLHVETVGKTGHPAVLWLPDTLSLHTAACWDTQFTSVLANQYYLVRYDPLGVGESSKPLDHSAYTIAQQMENLHQVLTGFFDAGQPVVIVAAGWSGVMLSRYLARYPRWVRSPEIVGIVFVGAVTQVQPRWRDLAYTTVKGLGSYLTANEEEIRLGAIETVLQQSLDWYGYQAFKTLAKSLRTMIAAARTIPPCAIQTWLNEYEQQGNDGEIGVERDLPVLVLHGERDPLVSLLCANVTCKFYPDAQVIQYRGGHDLFSQGAIFTADIATFLASVFHEDC